MLGFLATTEIPGVPGDLASLGVIALALIVGMSIVYKWALVPEREARGMADREVKELNKAAIDRLLPAVLSATHTLAETQKLLAELQYRGRNGPS